MKFAVLSIILPALGLASCTSIDASYIRQTLPTAPRWNEAAAMKAAFPSANWWQSFGDPRMSQLVETVLASNNDILTAALRSRKAVLQAQLTGVNELPTVTGTAKGQASKALRNGTVSREFTFELGSAYEIDLWGRLAAARDVSALQADATAEDLLTARTMVAASAMEAYWRLAYINQDMAEARDTLASARKIQSLVTQQMEIGSATELEVSEIRQTVEEQAALLSDAEQSRAVVRNTLTVLLNGQALPVAEPLRLASRMPEPIAPGLPAELLARRPDLRAAELRLRATLKVKDVERRSLYPQISLTGTLGGTSTELAQLLSNPLATLGTGVTLPFLNLKDGKLRVAVSDADYQIAASEFRSSLLTAFSETSTALGARATLRQKGRHLNAALDAAETAAKLIEERYRAGSVELRVWIDAQNRSRAARRAYTANRLEQLLTEIQIFRVLGGPPSKISEPLSAALSSTTN